MKTLSVLTTHGVQIQAYKGNLRSAVETVYLAVIKREPKFPKVIGFHFKDTWYNFDKDTWEDYLRRDIRTDEFKQLQSGLGFYRNTQDTTCPETGETIEKGCLWFRVNQEFMVLEDEDRIVQREWDEGLFDELYIKYVEETIPNVTKKKPIHVLVIRP